MCLETVLNLLTRLTTCDESDVTPIAHDMRRELNLTPAQGMMIIETLGDDGCYSLSHFIDRVAARRNGKVYGYQIAYARASLHSAHPATQEMIVKWKRLGRVPKEYVEQIGLLEFIKTQRKPRRPTRWTQEETDYLRVMYDEDARVSNSIFAHKCSLQFGRIITINAIKGMLYRIKEDAKLVA